MLYPKALSMPYRKIGIDRVFKSIVPVLGYSFFLIATSPFRT